MLIDMYKDSTPYPYTAQHWSNRLIHAPDCRDSQRLGQQNQQDTYDKLSCTERLELLLNQEFQTQEHRKQDRLVRQARWKLNWTSRYSKRSGKVAFFVWSR